MILDGKELLQRQYHHVRVVTTFRKASDFDPQKSYPFVVRDLKDTCCDTLVYAGYLKAFDPISKSAILCQIGNRGITKNIFILGHSIKHIESSEGNNLMLPCDVQKMVELYNSKKLANHPFFANEDASNSLTDEDVRERRDDIVTWLTKLRIPVKTDAITNEIIVADSVRIRPPYENVTNYVCPTRVVLSRVKRIVDSRKVTNT